MLQWGRNFIVAEIVRKTATAFLWIAASMGPQLYRCGNVYSPAGLARTLMGLQWGRNFIVAEICLGIRSIMTAITMLQWGRNFIVAEMNGALDNITTDAMLQWGRNFIVAEIHTRGCTLSASVRASMGPQLYRCGNRRIAPCVNPIAICFNGAATLSLRKFTKLGNKNGNVYIVVLQWGRNFIVAEIRPACATSRCRSWSLQWGRNFIVAEMGKTWSSHY